MSKYNKPHENFQQILRAIENFRNADRSQSGMIYTDNWYDSHPRLLLFDPILTPYDKLIWMTIRTFCSPALSLAAFPSYNDIQACLHVSRATVSSSIAKLRVTRWITLVCREQIRDANGQFSRDGNIYLVHGEPLSLADTLDVDSNYMSYLNDCRQHRNSDTRKISEMILSSIDREMDSDRDLMDEPHPFERRKMTWDALAASQNDAVAPSTGTRSSTSNPSTLAGLYRGIKAASTEVQPMNCGVSSTAVQSANRGNFPVNCGEKMNQTETNMNHSSSGCSRNSSRPEKNLVEEKYHYTNVNEMHSELTDLIFPSSLSDNQIQLIGLHLLRLPKDLPPPPKPWQTWAQLLLDELEGRLQAGSENKNSIVWNPVSLFSTYCKRLADNGIGLREAGQFQLELAYSTLESRTTAAKHQNALKNAEDTHRRQLLERLRITREREQDDKF